jgi:hypothetical protein
MPRRRVSTRYWPVCGHPRVYAGASDRECVTIHRATLVPGDLCVCSSAGFTSVRMADLETGGVTDRAATAVRAI